MVKKETVRWPPFTNARGRSSGTSADGRWRNRSSRTTDKAAAQRLANKLQSDGMLVREGVIDRAAVDAGKAARRSIEEHLVDFKAKMVAAGRSPKYVEDTLFRIRAVGKAANYKTVGQIDATGVNRFVANQLDARMSARRVQGYLIAIKSFSRWLSRQNKLPRNPLESVNRPNPATDRRATRRILLSEEWTNCERRSVKRIAAALPSTPTGAC